MSAPPPLPARNGLYYVLPGARSGSGLGPCSCRPGEPDSSCGGVRTPPVGSVVRAASDAVDSDGDALVVWLDHERPLVGFVLYTFLRSVDEVEAEVAAAMGRGV